MANTGAHLVDRVVPDVPVRQLVLSIPYELRMLAAFKPDVLTALSRIFVEVAFASYRARAKKLRGIEGRRDRHHHARAEIRRKLESERSLP
jgi:hypothetical protein